MTPSGLGDVFLKDFSASLISCVEIISIVEALGDVNSKFIGVVEDAFVKFICFVNIQMFVRFI